MISVDIQKLKEAIALLEEKLQSKTFVKAVGGRRTADAIKLLVDYVKSQLKLS